MSEPRPSELAEACRRGEEAAFAELYRQFADGVFHVTMRILRNREDAADALQETFLLAFRHFSTYRGEGSLKGWLFRVAVRAALRIRRRGRPGQSLDDEEAPPVEAAPQPAPLDADFESAVQREIDRLPERARIVFILHTTEGLTHAEIAEALGVNEGTSKSQLNYARSLLRKRLARFCDDLL